MHIIETCPKCGADLEYLTYATNPPIPARRCRKCGWHWEGKPGWGEVMRVPFAPPEPPKEGQR